MAHADEKPRTPGRHTTIRRLVLTSVMAWAVLLALGGHRVSAQTTPPLGSCDQVSGSTVTCSGDVQTGVLLDTLPPPFTGLNVNNLTTNITPLSGVAGVEFTSSGVVTLNVITGPFQIFTDGASGIFAGELGVTIVSTADITTTGDDAVGIRR